MYGGGFADVYRGECKGRSVAIKVPRLYACNDRDLDLSVGIPLHILFKKPTLTQPHVEVLQRSRCLETPKAPEYSTIARRDTRTAQVRICVGMDG